VPARGEPQSAVPAIAVADAGDAAAWEAWARSVSFRVIVPEAAANNADARAQAVAAAVAKAIEAGQADPARTYLVGRGATAAAVPYIVSRFPDLFAAAAAIGGFPHQAVETDRIFAANFRNTPLLWVTTDPDAPTLAAPLQSAGIPLAVRPAAAFGDAALAAWLGEHRRDPVPLSVDCETNSPTFASCFWIRMTVFDAAERNDVLPTSRMVPGPGAGLDLGSFRYKTDSEPGILVTELGEKYKGPLKVNDRLVALDGRPIENPRQLLELLSRYTEEKNAAVTVQRGKDRLRVETRVLIPRRQPLVTARVQGQYLPAEHVIQIVSRTVKQMRVTVPPAWDGATLYWNGLVLEKTAPGCLLLSSENGLLNAGKCP
jgi:hypothetical protein